MTNQMKKLTMALCLMLLTAWAGWAQITVKGVVVDANGPVIGAAVMEVGTTNGASTDVDGSFQFTVSRSNATVEVSCIGYATQTFAANQVPARIVLVVHDAPDVRRRGIAEGIFRRDALCRHHRNRPSRRIHQLA